MIKAGDTYERGNQILGAIREHPQHEGVWFFKLSVNGEDIPGVLTMSYKDLYEEKWLKLSERIKTNCKLQYELFKKHKIC